MGGQRSNFFIIKITDVDIVEVNLFENSDNNSL